MTDDQWQCFEMLCELYGGAHHVFGKVTAIGNYGIQIHAQYSHNIFGTFDYDVLTKAVVLAHDRMIRFAIEPSRAGALKLSFMKRHTRDGDVSSRHPTLEAAIEKFRAVAK